MPGLGSLIEGDGDSRDGGARAVATGEGDGQQADVDRTASPGPADGPRTARANALADVYLSVFGADPDTGPE